jgi:peptide/nickel transport system permease protein
LKKGLWSLRGNSGKTSRGGKKTITLARETWTRVKKNRMAMVGLGIIIIFCLIALFAPHIAPHDPTSIDPDHRRIGPTLEYPLGTDVLGRCILSRIIYGSRIAWTAGILSVGVAMIFGLPLGLMAGYFGGRLDYAISAAVDMLLAFPYLLMAILIVTLLGPSIQNAILAIGIRAIPIYVRLMRGTVLAAKENEYTMAAKAIGCSEKRLIFLHLLPNCMAPIIVFSTLQIATSMLAEASLSFLGLGAQPPQPSWGSMVSEGRSYLRASPHISTFPGLAIMLVVLGFNLFGDGLRDALDPRLKEGSKT